MAARHRFGFTLPRMALVLGLFAAAAAPGNARAGGIFIANTYHAQVTNYFCGAAAMEMMLDTPSTTTFGLPNYDQNVVNLLAPGDGGTSPPNPFPNAPPAGAQASLYSIVHGSTNGGLGAFGNFSVYNNPAYGPGTDPIGFAAGLNAIDNPTNANNANVSNLLGNGVTNNGNQQYAAYAGSATFPATVAAGLNASNTVAAALLTYKVPASVSINNGGHWIDVNGVSTSTVGNTTFINGFFIRDPWTGYARAQHQTNLGLGINTYLRYGYDHFANNSTRIGGWFNYFTPASNKANAGRGVGYSIEIEPQGPELPDLAGDFSLPVVMSGSSDLNASQALADASSDLADTAGLSGESGFEGGNGFDGSDEVLKSMPGDTSGEGDWLVPYDGSGGINDVTGFLLIDEQSGVIDQATWFDPSDALTLADADAMFNAEAFGIADPNDNAAPEPPGCVLMVVGIASCGLLFVRRRSAGGCLAAPNAGANG
jgi:hypothetical protein